MTTDNMAANGDYLADLHGWRQKLEHDLTSEDGWLTVVGLDWLREGDNTLGSAPGTDVTLPERAPADVGRLTLADGVVTLHATADVPVLVDGSAVRTAVLRPDVAKDGPSRVFMGPVNFFIIRRGDSFGVRIRDRANAARATFGGRQWYPVDDAYRVTGQFVAHEPPRTVEVSTSAGLVSPMQNIGRVDFTLRGEALSLEAFASSGGDLWFIFKDTTSGKQTYGAGRFMYAPLASDGTVALDFNRAYHPPCAFTHFATCPLPPRENILPIAIEAGEHS